jgi:predicted dehydrogenase
MSRPSRRSFLKIAAAGAGTLALGAADALGKDADKRAKKTPKPKMSSNIVGANQRVRIAVAGIHGRGLDHIKNWTGIDGVEIAYLVDPDTRLFESRQTMIQKKFGYTPKCVADIRTALADKDVDAVSIATCNHWHSLITIWACQAGKDVYVEKPCSHNVFEGRQCVEAARKYKRIVQHGTQRRGETAWARTVAAVASGKYGKLLVSKAYASKSRWSIGFKHPADVPAGLNYDVWLGPAPQQPYDENHVHYNWHWFWDTGNGEVGNQGVHQIDVARWAIPGATLPKTAISMGGRWVDGPENKDQGQTPNMHLSVFDFGGTLLVVEIRGLVDRRGKGPGKNFSGKTTNEFYLEAGTIVGNKFYPKGKKEPERLSNPDVELESGGVFQNFIDCVRSRKPENLLAPILEGHRSAALCHLANASYRIGHDVPFSEKPAALGETPEILASVSAIEENLQGALGLDLAKSTYRLGAKLNVDAATGNCIDNPAANALLTRQYRKPYVVPEVV